jgi:hypothetical protein
MIGRSSGATTHVDAGILILADQEAFMGAICRIYERTGDGVRVIAQIRDGKVTGVKAAHIREVLVECGFPNAPLEDVLDQLLLSQPGLGVAYILKDDEE